MHTAQFWFLFIYVSLVLIVETYHWQIYNKTTEDSPTYYCDEETANRVVGLTPFKPDENGIVGSATDSNGREYYLVLVPKDELDAALNNEETSTDIRKD